MQAHTAAVVGSALAGLLFASTGAIAKVDCHKPFPEERHARSASGGRAQVSLEPMQENGITYVTGGIGPDEQAAIRRMRDYNVRISMQTPCGRAHVAHLRIENGDGQTVVESPAAGPIFLAKMPAGTYRLRVTSQDGAPLEQTLTVPAKANANLRLTVPAQDRSSAGDAPISW